MRKLRWEEPPKPRGKKGQKRRHGHSQGFGTNTDLGRIGEQAFAAISGGKIEHDDTKHERSPLDVVGQGVGTEVKGQSVLGTEFKSGLSRKETAEKEAEAKRRNLTGQTAIVILDPKTKVAHAYTRPGFKSGRLIEDKGWSFAGRAILGNEGWRRQKRDPRTGRWI